MKQELKHLETKGKELKLNGDETFERLQQEVKVSKTELTAIAERKAVKVIAEVMEWKNGTVGDIAKAAERAEKDLKLQYGVIEKLTSDIQKTVDVCSIHFAQQDVKSLRTKMDQVSMLIEEHTYTIPPKATCKLGNIQDDYDVNLGTLRVSAMPFLVKG